MLKREHVFSCAEWKIVGKARNARRGPSRHHANYQLSAFTNLGCREKMHAENLWGPSTPQTCEAEGCHAKTRCVNLLENYARVF